MEDLGLDIESFGRWAAGNLVDNRNRGIFAEWLVGQALEAIDEGEFRQEWDPWVWVPIIRSWALTRGFALHPGTRNRYEIRYTRTQHRPPSRQVNDHGRVSGTHMVQGPLAKFATTIKNKMGAERDAYRRVQEQTPSPERVTVDLRDNLSASTKSGGGEDLPTYKGHLYSDESGLFPADLNAWERTVIEREIEESTFVAWYRNPSRASPAALRIAYQTDAENWASLQPDFVVVSRRSDGSLGASIIDPHSDHLADARAKLKALVDYVQQYGSEFVRIESLAKNSDDELVALDLQNPTVREAIRNFDGGQISAIYDSEVAQPHS